MCDAHIIYRAKQQIAVRQTICHGNQKQRAISWKNLIADITINNENAINNYESIVEYVDVEENNTLMIASVYGDLFKGKKGERLQLKYTHNGDSSLPNSGSVGEQHPFLESQSGYQATKHLPVLGSRWECAHGGRIEKAYQRHCDWQRGEVLLFVHPRVQKCACNVQSTHKDIYTLYTVSGRKITATYDHKFMTNHGWVAMKEAYKQKYKVGISFDYQEVWPLLDTDKDILKKHVTHSALQAIGDTLSLPDATLIEYESQINESCIYEKQGVLARVLGYAQTMISDFTSETFEISSSSYTSALVIVDDIKLLGFIKYFILRVYYVYVYVYSLI